MNNEQKLLLSLIRCFVSGENIESQKNINFDEKFIDEKIAEYIKGKDNLELKLVVILRNGDKICADCLFEQIFSNGTTSSYHVDIPLD